ncbi:hypothetical protein DH2020_013640 [Rehmannia glutinosa]|uniref:PPM-type phosphatase domain-containing protein n=1 Tax=Rehmannia glutinosa TaxID=99300 RepID=A0ABR0X463_REHGL
MAAPESDSNAKASDIKRPNELIDSNSSPRKRLKTEDELKTEGTTNEASSANGSSHKGFFALEADAAEDKGSRHSMEDAWVVLLDASLESPGNLRCAHFAIYDGHGGRLAAEYAQKHLHKHVLSAGLPRELLDVKCAKKAILNGFRKTDEALLQESAAVHAATRGRDPPVDDVVDVVGRWIHPGLPLVFIAAAQSCIREVLGKFGGWQDGATAVCMWVLGQTVFVANIGDAKAVVARSAAADGSQGGSDSSKPLKAIVLTRNTKPYIHKNEHAGGSISSNGRLQGRLEVSRAFGDRQFKKGAPFDGQDTLFILIVMLWSTYLVSNDIHEKCLYEKLMHEGLFTFLLSDSSVFAKPQPPPKVKKEGLPVTAVCRPCAKLSVNACAKITALQLSLFSGSTNN